MAVVGRPEKAAARAPGNGCLLVREQAAPVAACSPPAGPNAASCPSSQQPQRHSAGEEPMLHLRLADLELEARYDGPFSARPAPVAAEPAAGAAGQQPPAAGARARWVTWLCSQTCEY